MLKIKPDIAIMKTLSGNKGDAIGKMPVFIGRKSVFSSF